jgi:FeoB-associated Cys-rich membrane protein
MNATLDTILVALAILAALAFLARGFFRRKKKGCSTGCGCDAAKPLSKKPVISTEA